MSSNELLEANVVALRADLTDFKAEFRAVVARIDHDIRAMAAKAESEIKVAVARMDEQFREVRQDIRELRADNKAMREKIDGNFVHHDQKVDANFTHVNQKIDASFSTLDQKIDTAFNQPGTSPNSGLRIPGFPLVEFTVNPLFHPGRKSFKTPSCILLSAIARSHNWVSGWRKPLSTAARSCW